MLSMLNHLSVIAALALVSSFAAAGEASPSARPPLSLDDILKSTPQSPEKSGIPEIRYNAIRETAMTYGAQAGLARRSFDNGLKLERQAINLDIIYNFQALMVEGNVLPPVLSETSDVYDQTSEDMLRVINKVYRIEQQARFTYVPPTWRSYMMSGYEFDGNVVASVSPQTPQEQALWRAGVEEGYRLGESQADEILKQNFATLQRDFLGMVLYHRMLDSSMVTKPFVASSRQGVARAKDGSMHIGEVFLRITAAPDFIDSTDKWKSGPRAAFADRLKRAADPEQAAKLLQDARESGMVREKGR